MPKWDYVCVNLVRSYGMNYRRNGIKMAEWKDKPVFEMMQILGDEGYEFAAYDGQNYIFKKPVAIPQPQAGAGSQQVRTPTPTAPLNPQSGTNPQQPRPAQPQAGAAPQQGQPRPPAGVQPLQRPPAGVQPLQRPPAPRPIQPPPGDDE